MMGIAPRQIIQSRQIRPLKTQEIKDKKTKYNIKAKLARTSYACSANRLAKITTRSIMTGRVWQ